MTLLPTHPIDLSEYVLLGILRYASTPTIIALLTNPTITAPWVAITAMAHIGTAGLVPSPLEFGLELGGLRKHA